MAGARDHLVLTQGPSGVPRWQNPDVRRPSARPTAAARGRATSAAPPPAVEQAIEPTAQSGLDLLAKSDPADLAQVADTTPTRLRAMRQAAISHIEADTQPQPDSAFAVLLRDFTTNPAVIDHIAERTDTPSSEVSDHLSALRQSVLGEDDGYTLEQATADADELLRLQAEIKSFVAERQERIDELKTVFRSHVGGVLARGENVLGDVQVKLITKRNWDAKKAQAVLTDEERKKISVLVMDSKIAERVLSDDRFEACREDATTSVEVKRLSAAD